MVCYHDHFTSVKINKDNFTYAVYHWDIFAPINVTNEKYVWIKTLLSAY